MVPRTPPINPRRGSTVNKVVTSVRDRKSLRRTDDSKAAGKETAAEERIRAEALIRGPLTNLTTLMAAAAGADREARLVHSMPRKPVPEETSMAPRRPPMVGQRSRLRSERTNPKLHRKVHPLIVADTVNRRRRPVSPVDQRPINSKDSARRHKAPSPLQGTNPTMEVPRRLPLVLHSTRPRLTRRRPPLGPPLSASSEPRTRTLPRSDVCRLWKK